MTTPPIYNRGVTLKATPGAPRAFNPPFIDIADGPATENGMLGKRANELNIQMRGEPISVVRQPPSYSVDPLEVMSGQELLVPPYSRRRVDIGGNPGEQLPMFNVPAPQMGYAAPPTALSVDALGAARLSSLQAYDDRDFARGQRPVSGADMFELSGMPERPSLFDSYIPGSDPTFDPTASDARIRNQDTSGNSNVVDTLNPLANFPWARAAAQTTTIPAFGPNESVKYTFQLSGASAAYVQRPLKAAVVGIERTGTVEVPSFRSRFGLVATQEEIVNLFSLPVLNFQLSVAQQRERSPADVWKPRDVLSKFHIVGVACSDLGATWDARNVADQTRNVVTIMGGDTTEVFNYWQKTPWHGGVLGFKLVGVPRTKIWASNHTVHGSYNLSPDDDQDERILNAESAKVPLQFIPWSGPPGSRPRPAELRYLDAFGCEHTGVFIMFGRVQEYHPGYDQKFVDRAPFSAYAASRAGTMRVLVSRQLPPV